MGHVIPWSKADSDSLRIWWNEGLSAREIAKKYGDGRTRCSIIGRAHRMGLPRRASVQARPKVKERLSFWTDARVEKLTAMHLQGVFYRDIAGVFGCTAHAIQSKIYRLGLSSAQGSEAHRARSGQGARPRPNLTLVCEPAPEGGVHLLDLEPHHCRWVLSEPRYATFCGAKKYADKPYCAHHCYGTGGAYQYGTATTAAKLFKGVRRWA